MIDNNPLSVPPQSAIVAEIIIRLVQQEGKVDINVSSSADPIMSLGLLEIAKDALKAQSNQPRSPLVVARGNVPRIS
jgi:hypothetical protein